MAETHPLDEQNAIERKIQLEGPRDPDNFRMPDGRTLTEVRTALNDQHKSEFKENDEKSRLRSRELSLPELSKGEKLVMTTTGSVIDVTEPKKVETTISDQPETLPPSE
jgi:hypothetical protein